MLQKLVRQPDYPTRSRDAMAFNSVSVIRPYEQIVLQIQQAIRGGHLPRESKLPTERKLAEQFGVSRSVVREAIKVLAAQGLVESRQGSGIFVCDTTIESVSRAFVLSVSPDAESVELLFEFRLVLEAEAARLASSRRTEDQLAAMESTLDRLDATLEPDNWELFGEVDPSFHLLIAEACGNPYLQVAIASVRDMQNDVVHLFAEQPGSMQEAMTHHRAVCDAIRNRDPTAASRAMAKHIDYTSGVVQTHIPPSRRRSIEIPITPPGED